MSRLKFTQQVLFALLILSSCTKIDTTQLGSELIPVVDNIKTFDTTLQVIANNYLDLQDYHVFASSPHVVGAISQDPVFGSSQATLFFSMNPTNYPFQFANADSVKDGGVAFDSAVLILNYLTYYGDSSVPVNVNLYESASNVARDTSLLPFYNLQAKDLAVNSSKLLGTATVQPVKFRDSVILTRGNKEIGRVANQLRIRLNQDYARELFLDSLMFKSDTVFKKKYKGFALSTDPTVNTLLYFGLTGSSQLEFYYRTKLKSDVQDTTSTSFSFTGSSGHAVRYETFRNGSEVTNALIPDPINGNENIYIQTSPGVSATLRIPGLTELKKRNRIINLADLRIVQLKNDQGQLISPQALYLDVLDTVSNTKIYRGVPFDLSPFSNYYCFPNPNSGINFGYFGGIRNTEKINNVEYDVYHFNISRYVQSIVTRNETIYEFRLSAPYYLYYQNCSNGEGTTPSQIFPFVVKASQTSSTIINPIGRGRVKVAGGNNPNTDIQMQLRIIYSAL